MELTQPSYELCIHITYIHWYGSTEYLAYAAVAAAERAAARGTAPHILLVLRAAESPQSRRRLATKAFTLSTANGALCTAAVEEASIYCTNWPTFAKNQ